MSLVLKLGWAEETRIGKEKIWTNEKISCFLEENPIGFSLIDSYRVGNSALRCIISCNVCGSQKDIGWKSICEGQPSFCKQCYDNEVLSIEFNQKLVDKKLVGYKVLNVKRVKDSKVMVKVKCPMGHKAYWGYRGHLELGHGCNECKKNNLAQPKTWKKERIANILTRYNFTPVDIDSFHTSDLPICVKNKDGYMLNVNIYRLEKFNYPMKNIFINNDYLFYNVNLWCKLNRPDYKLIKFNGNSSNGNLKNLSGVFYYSGKYISSKTNREFVSMVSDFLYSGNEHPYLKMSKGERMVDAYLKKHEVKFICQKTFDDLKNPETNYKLRLDFYIPNLKVAIEVSGKQHYQPIKMFGGEDAFKKSVYRDQLKRDYCNNNNIKLVEISYLDYGSMYDIINYNIGLKT